MVSCIILNSLRSFPPKVNVGNETNLVQVRFRVVTDGNLSYLLIYKILEDLAFLCVRESIMKILTIESYVSTINRLIYLFTDISSRFLLVASVIYILQIYLK